MCLPAPLDAAPATIVMGTVSLSSTTSAAAADQMMMASTTAAATKAVATPQGNVLLPRGGPMARRSCGGNRECREAEAAGWEEEIKKKTGPPSCALVTDGWRHHRTKTCAACVCVQPKRVRGKSDVAGDGTRTAAAAAAVSRS